MMNQLYLVGYGEIALKGENKPFFFNTLEKNIYNSLKGYRSLEIFREQGRFFVKVEEDKTQVIDRLRKIFGITFVSPVIQVSKDIEEIKKASITQMSEIIGNEVKTFKVIARRSDKSYPL